MHTWYDYTWPHVDRVYAAFDLTLIETVRPGHNPSPPPARALDVLAYYLMTAYSESYATSTRWTTFRLADFLAGSGGGGFPGTFCVATVDGIQIALCKALLAEGHAGIELWRRECRIHVDERHRVRAPHRRPSCWGWDKFAALLGATGTTTARLNYVHDDAVEIHGVHLHVSAPDYTPSAKSTRRPWTWRAELNFGVDGSRWYHTLATQRPGEPVEDMLTRAARMLEIVRHTPLYVDRWYEPGGPDEWCVFRNKEPDASDVHRMDRLRAREIVSRHVSVDDAVEALLALAEGARP